MADSGWSSFPADNDVGEYELMVALEDLLRWDEPSAKLGSYGLCFLNIFTGTPCWKMYLLKESAMKTIMAEQPQVSPKYCFSFLCACWRFPFRVFDIF